VRFSQKFGAGLIRVQRDLMARGRGCHGGSTDQRKKGKKERARAAVGRRAGATFGRCAPLRLVCGWSAGPGQTLGPVSRISLFFLFIFLFFCFSSKSPKIVE
jgi:hypothetical protein